MAIYAVCLFLSFLHGGAMPPLDIENATSAIFYSHLRRTSASDKLGSRS